jgi:hypothetical protein
MVYTKLELVLGCVIDEEQLRTLLDYKGNVDVDEMDVSGMFDDICVDKDIKLFTFPCCSESRGKKFIIGMSMHTYYRKPIKCRKM